MADRISSVLDHVAVAVGDFDTATRRWVDQLGAGQVTRGGNHVFRSRQFRFGNGARLELLAPGRNAAQNPFVPRFLDRFGSTVHHVTLKVADLPQALGIVAGGGLEPVDVNDADERWQEAFLRPSQVGGLVVQIAHTSLDDSAWAALTGFVPRSPRPDAATLLGPRLRHPDLDYATALWTLLGASVEVRTGDLLCTWPDSPLSVVVEAGEPAGPVALRMTGTDPLPPEDGVGPAVEVE